MSEQVQQRRWALWNQWVNEPPRDDPMHLWWDWIHSAPVHMSALCWPVLLSRVHTVWSTNGQKATQWVWGVKHEAHCRDKDQLETGGLKKKKSQTHFTKSIYTITMGPYFFFFLEPESCCGMYVLWNSSTSREHKLFLLLVGFISTESFTWSQQNFQRRQERV